METCKQFIFSGIYFSPDVEHCENVDNFTFIVKVYDEIKESSIKPGINKKIVKAFAPLGNQLRDSILNYTIPELNKPTAENLRSWLWRKLYPLLPTMTKLEVQMR